MGEEQRMYDSEENDGTWRGVASFRTYGGAGSTWERVQEPKLVTASIWGQETRGRVRTR